MHLQSSLTSAIPLHYQIPAKAQIHSALPPSQSSSPVSLASSHDDLGTAENIAVAVGSKMGHLLLPGTVATDSGLAASWSD